MVTRIQLRRDTAANWTSTNPILDQGEPGYETDTGNIKYGNGSSRWSALSYGGGPSGPGAGSYSLPTASGSTLGGIKIGSGLSIDGSGVVTASGGGGGNYTLPAATSGALGGVIIPVVGTSGITNSAGTIGLATASRTQLGGVTLGPVLSAYQAVAQSSISLDQGSPTTIIYDTETFRDGGSYNTGTGIFTPGRTGYYQVNANVTITTINAPGGTAYTAVGIGVVVNSTLFDINLIPASWGDTTPLVSTIVKLTSTSDTIKIVAAVSEATDHTGGTYPTNAANACNSVFSVAFLRDI